MVRVGMQLTVKDSKVSKTTSKNIHGSVENVTFITGKVFCIGVVSMLSPLLVVSQRGENPDNRRRRVPLIYANR